MGIDRREFLLSTSPRSRDEIRGSSGSAAGTDAIQSAPQAQRRSNSTLAPYRGVWDYSRAAHLLRRSSFSVTEAQVQQAISDGPEVTIQKLFTPFTPDVSELRAWEGSETFQISPEQGQDPQDFQRQLQERRFEFVRWWLRQMLEGPLSLQERLTFFWHGHFTTELQVVRYAEVCYEQNQLLRRSVLGNFKRFVLDISTDMAMLIYLDGIRNFKIGDRDNINENYARELMELYTMGVYDWEGNPNYTEEDVAEAARALSGWSYNVPPRGEVNVDRAPQFKLLLWDGGEKTIMGRTGPFNTESLIDLLFEERAEAIARFVCEKLYRFFVYDIPDRTIIDAMASTFRESNWEIEPVVSELLRSEHFYDETNIGAMHKSPIDYMLGLFSALGVTRIPGFDAEVRDRLRGDFGGRLDVLGQVPYNPPNVKGWPGGRTWISTSTLPVRQKFGIDVSAEKIDLNSNGREYFYTFDPIAFASQFSEPNDIYLLAEEMSRSLLNREPSDEEAQMLTETLLDGGVDYEWSIDDPMQRPEERIRKFLQAIVKLAKFQLY